LLTTATVDPWLVQAAEAVSDHRDSLGVLVYGSYISGSFGPESDLDLICVTRGGQVRQFRRLVDGREVDVYVSPRLQISKVFHSDFPDNNNFVLQAFVRGRLVSDPYGDLAELIREAQRVWDEGPPKPSHEGKQRIAANQRVILGVADGMAKRGTRSAQWREMMELLSGRFFLDCFYQYCRVYRLWSSAMWEMLAWTDPRYGQLLSITRNYLDDPSLDHRLQAIRMLAQATIKACQNGREIDARLTPHISE